MNILKSIYIAQREWDNIRISLKYCGDIGPYNSPDTNRNIKLIHGNDNLIGKLIAMSNKFNRYGYYTREASFVFDNLANRAGRKLGLTQKFSSVFGNMYSLFRTEYCILDIDIDSDEVSKDNLLKQFFIYEQIYPISEFHNWNFSSVKVKNKFKQMYDRLIYWQNNNGTLEDEFQNFKQQSENTLNDAMEDYITKHRLDYLRNYHHLDMAS